MIQKASRKTKASKELKAEAIACLEQKNFQESERIVAELFDLPVLTGTKCTQQKDESVRIELTLTKAQAEKLEQVKALMSHLVPDGKVAEILDVLMTQKLAATMAVKSEIKDTNKTVTPKTRKIILKRDQCCQFKSPITGKICGSKWQLQVDHRQSKWANGTNAAENLQVLYGQHNRFKFKQEASIH